MNRYSNKSELSYQKYILLISVIATSVVVAALGLMLSGGGGNPIEKFMLLLRDGFETEEPVDPPDTEQTKQTEPPVADSTGDSSQDGTATPPDTDSTPLPPDTEPIPVTPEEYYSDALFIGDSRTVGLWTYGRIEGASYFARTSMNVSNCFADKKSETGTGSLNLEEYLKKNRFGKIYILLGINEIGYSYSWIVSKYEALLERLHELQPDAILIIQSNMHVTKAKSDKNPDTFNNGRIDELNRRLSKLADGETVFYLGFEKIFDDENGNLRADYTGDGVHLKGKCYSIWRDYLTEHGMIAAPGAVQSGIVSNPSQAEPTAPGEESVPDTSVPDTTVPGVTEPPTTEPPETEPPTTEPPTTEPPTTEPPETDPPTTDVPTVKPPKGYFDDVLFLGDSRIVGLYYNGRIDGASYFAWTGMTVQRCFSDRKSETGTGDLTLEEYLEQNQFGKIYLLLGINEIGDSPENITRNYAALIKRILALQPDAVVVIQSNMHVTAEKEESNAVFSNDRIDALNRSLKTLADGKTIYYLGYETIFDDENGDLREDLSRDGLHFKAAAYDIWKEWLLDCGGI